MDTVGDNCLSCGCGQPWDKPRHRSTDKFGDEIATHYESCKGVIPAHQITIFTQAGDIGEKFDSTHALRRFGTRFTALLTPG